ncbi:MAG TPA: peptide deformylase [Thermoanaerobaculia bacterium]|nr:peptide deformylase [Thermoanaerobaculia bacterium]
MAILSIRLYPDPVLRVKCPPVERFDEELRNLAADMVETMHAAPGVGLAAPQVGVELRLAVVDLSVGKDPEELLILVNPEVLDEEGRASETEGCLSIPDLTDKVERPERVRLRAHDLAGRPFELEADDWLARAVLHEIDHLDGVLFVDRLRGLRKERARRALKKLAEAYEEVPA